MRVSAAPLSHWTPRRAGETIVVVASVELLSSPQVTVLAEPEGLTSEVVDAVRGRAYRGPARFHLLVPSPAHGMWSLTRSGRRRRRLDAELVLFLGLALLSEAVGGVVEGSLSPRNDPLDAIEEFLYSHGFDEVILDWVPPRRPYGLRTDLAHRVAHLGVVPAITTVGHTSRAHV
jgi:hypothetical protein